MEDQKPLMGTTTMIMSSSFNMMIKHSWPFLLLLFTVIAVFTIQSTVEQQPSSFFFSPSWAFSGQPDSPDTAEPLPTCSWFFLPIPPARFVASITDFGGVGDGETSNTEAFRKAVEHLRKFQGRGGSQLNVPRGRWITGSFNLTSNFTLFLEEGAVILGSLDPKDWPIIEPLPSYGRGRERAGGRHISLIHANGLSNVVITGLNGIIDGQGKMWWDQWWNRTLKHTRGHLVELMNSNNIMISNLTFLNSPFWTIHPVYCSNILVKNMTILAPLNAPNTDGIDPGIFCHLHAHARELSAFTRRIDIHVIFCGDLTADSSTDVCIEDCYIESGDDLVAVKSGWDQYGIRMGRPSSNIVVRRISGTTPTCSGVGIGSEISGGVSNITIEDIHVWNSAAGIRIKADVGRGGYMTNISVANLVLDGVKIPIKFSRGANDHPDEGWDPKAVPRVKGIFIANVVSLSSKKAPELFGIKDLPYEDIYMKNISILGLSSSARWRCEYVSGFTSQVYPPACPQLPIDTGVGSSS